MHRKLIQYGFQYRYYFLAFYGSTLLNAVDSEQVKSIMSSNSVSYTSWRIKAVSEQ